MFSYRFSKVWKCPVDSEASCASGLRRRCRCSGWRSRFSHGAGLFGRDFQTLVAPQAGSTFDSFAKLLSHGRRSIAEGPRSVKRVPREKYFPILAPRGSLP